MLHIQPLPKPKPTKVIRKKKSRKNSQFCSCKRLSVNRVGPKTCAKCSKPLRMKRLHKALEIILDELVKEIVLNRDHFCVCPAPANRHGNQRTPGHLISRTRQSLRWSLLNTNEQCNSCNFLHEHKPEIYTAWFIREFGVEAYQGLVKDAENVQKLSVEQLQTLCSELTAIRARQEVDKDFKPRYKQEEILSGTWRKENEHDISAQWSEV